MPLLNTLSTCISKVVAQGYTECFKVTTRGLYSTSKSRYYRPEQVVVATVHHCEGMGEAGCIYLLETSDGMKGTLVDDYATYADGSVVRFMKEVDEIKKKMGGLSKNLC
jgi:hypothetical protein